GESPDAELPSYGGDRKTVGALEEARRPGDQAVHGEGNECPAYEHPDQGRRAEHRPGGLEEVAEGRSRDFGRFGRAADGHGYEAEYRPHDADAHAGGEHRGIEAVRQPLDQIERAGERRTREGEPDEWRAEPQHLAGPHAPTRVPAFHRGADARRQATPRLAQSGREHRKDKTGGAEGDEGGAPAVALGEHAAEPDPEHAAERHPNRV